MSNVVTLPQREKAPKLRLVHLDGEDIVIWQPCWLPFLSRAQAESGIDAQGLFADIQSGRSVIACLLDDEKDTVIGIASGTFQRDGYGQRWLTWAFCYGDGPAASWPTWRAQIPSFEARALQLGCVGLVVRLPSHLAVELADLGYDQPLTIDMQRRLRPATKEAS